MLSDWFGGQSEAEKQRAQAKAADDLFRRDVSSLQKNDPALARLECFHCQKIDDEARELDCGHSPYCLACLQDIATATKVICPCGASTALGSRQLENLPISLRRAKRLEWSKSVDAPFGVDSAIRSSDGSVYSKTTYVKDEELSMDYVVLGSSGKIRNPIFAYYVPFCFAESTAKRILIDWIKSHWFVPSDLDSELALVSLTKSFVPFYVFEVDTVVDYVCDIPSESDAQSMLPSWMSSITSYAHVKTYKTVAGKRSGKHANILQVATPSLNSAHIEQLVGTLGSFTFAERSGLPEWKRWEENPNNDVAIMSVDVDANEAWVSREHIVAKAELATCVSEVKSHYRANEVKDFEAFLRCTKVTNRLALLPIYSSIFNYRGKYFEIVCSGFRPGFVVGDRPGYGIGSALSGLPSSALSLLKNKI